MKKYILIVCIVFVGSSLFAQENTQKVTHVQKKNLIESTYYYADGSIQQVGTFNKAGELHGTWTSFDTQGNKLTVGSYENGKKVGKWLFYNNRILNEVSFVDSKIVNITSTENPNS